MDALKQSVHQIKGYIKGSLAAAAAWRKGDSAAGATRFTGLRAVSALFAGPARVLR